jgi:hypothetical protein
MCFIFKNNEIKVLIFFNCLFDKNFYNKIEKTTRKISNINNNSISNI